MPESGLTALHLSQFHVDFKHANTATTPRSRIAKLLEKEDVYGPLEFPFHSLPINSQ